MKIKSLGRRTLAALLLGTLGAAGLFAAERAAGKPDGWIRGHGAAEAKPIYMERRLAPVGTTPSSVADNTLTTGATSEASTTCADACAGRCGAAAPQIRRGSGGLSTPTRQVYFFDGHGGLTRRTAAPSTQACPMMKELQATNCSAMTTAQDNCSSHTEHHRS